MSGGERERSHVVRLVIAKRLSQRAASGRLGICVRQVKRLARAYRWQGDAGLVSKQRGRVSPRRLGASVRERIEGLLRGKYAGFGPTLAAEKLAEIEGIAISRESIRRLQIAFGLWKPKSRKARRAFLLRERRPRFGELIQIDGSQHDWFEGRAPRCALIVFIDDATGRLTALHMAPAELTKAYLVALRRHLLAYGPPLALYSDRHCVFRVNAKEALSGDGKTEFNRVTERLRIEQICVLNRRRPRVVSSAQSDLRIAWSRRCGFATPSGDGGRGVFPQFIESFNAKFAVAPQNLEDANRRLRLEPRRRRGFGVARRSRLDEGSDLQLRRGQIRRQNQGTGARFARRKDHPAAFHGWLMQARYKDRNLPFTAYGSCAVPTSVEDEKTIDARLDAMIAGLAKFPPSSRWKLNRAWRKAVDNSELRFRCRGLPLRSPLPTATQPLRSRGHSHVAETGDILIVR